MELWISGGGTAGHVYPALTVLDALGSRVERVAWLGRPGGLEERIVTARGVPFMAVASGPLVGAGPLGAARGALALARGTLSVARAIGARRPDAVFVTGGYVSVPAALGARLRGVPVAVFLPDVRPGRAVAAIARIARRVFVTDVAARAHLPAERVVVTGYPVRDEVRRADRPAARARLGVDLDDALVLIFGGSQGARRLNDAVAEAIAPLTARAHVLHLTGPRHADAAAARRAALPAAVRARYTVAPYLDGPAMADALAAADLAVCRAGASTLGELPARGLPAILVPLPIAGGHQWSNAHVLVAAGAAVAVADGQLDGARLAAEVAALLDDPARLAGMRRAASARDVPDAAAAIARGLVALAGGAA